MDLLYIWHDYRYWSKSLFGTIPTPAYELEVKVTDLEIYVKILRQFLRSLNPCMELLYIWHDYRYWSNFLLGTIPTHANDVEVKVTDLAIHIKVLCQGF